MKTKRYFFVAGSLILSLLLISCGGPAPTKAPTQPPAVQATKPPATQPAVATKAPTQPPATKVPVAQPTKVATTQPSAGTTLPVSGATSYRIRTIEHEGDSGGPVKSEWLQDVIVQPLAMHYVMTQNGREAMEMIVVGQSLWTKMMGGSWRETQLTDLGTSLAGIDQSGAVNVQEDVPLEDDLGWLMGQRRLYIAEGSMTPAGEEEVNGVPCKKYTVDSTYSYTTTLPAPLNATGKVTLLDTGEIWVADKSGWTPFVVRAQLTEVSTTEAGSASNTTTIFIEQDVTDVNSPDITIQPPQ